MARKVSFGKATIAHGERALLSELSSANPQVAVLDRGSLTGHPGTVAPTRGVRGRASSMHRRPSVVTIRGDRMSQRSPQASLRGPSWTLGSTVDPPPRTSHSLDPRSRCEQYSGILNTVGKIKKVMRSDQLLTFECPRVEIAMRMPAWPRHILMPA